MSPWGSEPSYPVQQVVIGINKYEIVEAKQFAWIIKVKNLLKLTF